MKKKLSIEKLIEEAEEFCKNESLFKNKDLFGVTDGKAVGTFIEHKFQLQLNSKYDTTIGSSASGIDLPGIDIMTDVVVSSIEKIVYFHPYTDVRQKIYGLGYNVLLFVYDKIDDQKTKTSKLNFVSCKFIAKERTGDYTLTFRLREMIADKANSEDISAYLSDKNIPADEITLNLLAESIIKNPPLQGYLTISNALQWRLQYGRIVNLTENIAGVVKIINSSNQYYF